MSMRTKKKLVQEVGINDLNEAVKVDGKLLPFYVTWRNMLCRCYSTKFQLTKPTYVGCTVCDEWKYLSNFKKWYDENYVDGFALDKDILFEGNKIYSPEFCRFVPAYLNSLLIDHGNARGDLPLGVSENKPNTKTGQINSTYLARCRDGYEGHLSKTFKTIEEAQA